MENSILNSTKKILGIAPGYTAFDLDIIIHINSVFAILAQLGIGPAEGFVIEDETANWSDFTIAEDEVNILNLVRTYVFLKVRMLFDPPTTSFLIESTNKQIQEYEWRLAHAREMTRPFIQPVPEEDLVWY